MFSWAFNLHEPMYHLVINPISKWCNKSTFSIGNKISKNYCVWTQQIIVHSKIETWWLCIESLYLSLHEYLCMNSLFINCLLTFPICNCYTFMWLSKLSCSLSHINSMCCISNLASKCKISYTNIICYIVLPI
jgi:hypothetical protein